jgi:hypothetical protein
MKTFFLFVVVCAGLYFTGRWSYAWGFVQGRNAGMAYHYMPGK